MRLIRGFHNIAQIPALKKGCVLTIGNFDGVHCGHSAVLQRLKQKSEALNVASVVMIFEPQPKEFFAEKVATSGQNSQEFCTPPARLMRLRDKFHYLSQLGIDYLLCVRFNDHFASLMPDDFIQHHLVDQLHIRYLSVGDDFHFGIHRSGNFATLQLAGQKFGFEVEDNSSYCFNKQRISSSLIREALETDQLDLAADLLGRFYTIRGRVAHGNKLGRTIGFPTANIMLNRRVSPIQGVYAVEVETPYGVYNGIANVGNRPTINGTKSLLEVHLFDFAQDLYGIAVEVRFLKKIRSEMKFASIDELKKQIEQDVIKVKDFFQRKSLL